MLLNKFICLEKQQKQSIVFLWVLEIVVVNSTVMIIIMILFCLFLGLKTKLALIILYGH